LLWLAAGAFCAVAAVIGILEFSPSKPASAGSGVGQIVGQQPTQQVPAPAQEPQQQPPQQQPAAQQPSQQQQTPPKTSTGAGNLAQRQPQQQNPPFTQQTPPQQQPAQQQPQQQQQIVTQAPLQQPQQAPQGPSAADLAKRAELKKAGDALDLLQVRAGTIHAKLTGLEQAQAAQGLGLRSDWVSARTLMDQFLKKAETSLGQGDPAAAQDALDKAERQAGVLEKALHI
jgi:outer membrane biosynthesis protein TonB